MWQRTAAESALSDILRRNEGTLPQSIEEWAEVARQYNLYLYIVEHTTAPAQTIDNTITIRSVSKAEVLQRRIVHELVEALTYRDCGILTIYYHGGDHEHHRVAQIAERLSYTLTV